MESFYCWFTEQPYWNIFIDIRKWWYRFQLSSKTTTSDSSSFRFPLRQGELVLAPMKIALTFTAHGAMRNTGNKRSFSQRSSKPGELKILLHKHVLFLCLYPLECLRGTTLTCILPNSSLKNRNEGEVRKPVSWKSPMWLLNLKSIVACHKATSYYVTYCSLPETYQHDFPNFSSLLEN